MGALALALPGFWLFSAVAFTVIVLRSVYRWRGENTAPCDPAFDPALREDEQWSGVETEWHAFLDSFGVQEVSR